MKKKGNDSPLEVGVWLGNTQTNMLEEIVECGPKRIRLRVFGSDTVTQMDRGEIERQLVRNQIAGVPWERVPMLILPPDSSGWKRRVKHYRESALVRVSQIMKRYDLDTVMLLDSTFLPQPAVIGKDTEGGTYSLLLGKE